METSLIGKYVSEKIAFLRFDGETWQILIKQKEGGQFYGSFK